MTAAEILNDLDRLGVRLRSRGGKLRFAPASAVTPELVERLKAHKGELLAMLAAPAPPIDFDAADAPIEWESTIEPVQCFDCGGLERHQDLLGEWHCSICHPPRGQELALAAERLRAAAKNRRPHAPAAAAQAAGTTAEPPDAPNALRGA